MNERGSGKVADCDSSKMPRQR